MISAKPVSVPRNAFRFCRVSVTLILWAGIIWRIWWLAALAGLIMLLSAILTITRAPMIVLWNQTIERIKPSPTELADENGMRFAHTVAFIMISAPLPFILLMNGRPEEIAWRFLWAVGIVKAISALGFCPATRFYTCMVGKGSCCSFLKSKPNG